MTEDFHMIQLTDTNKNDKNEKIRHYLLLENKMKVMLITNCSSKISVALDVNIGNFSDPHDFPGLAYLCQRILMCNNTHFKNKFQQLIYQYGYFSSTISSNNTTYYFCINTTNHFVFEEILDNFAAIFISMPLLDDDLINEEIQMMDSKLQTELQSNWFQYFERSSVDSTHPYSNYGLCDEKILTKMTVKQIKFVLINFLLTYYSANIMTLCIVSNYEPNKIKKKVVKIFSKIQNYNVTIPKFYDPFKNLFRTLWYIAPKSEIKNLRLSFPLPTIEEDCLRKAVNCISFFLESNNENSLLEILKANNWCSNISTGAHRETKNLNFFHIFITLLPEGYTHVEDIIVLFFEYLKLFKYTYFKSNDHMLNLNKVLSNMSRYGRFQEEKQEFTLQGIIKIVQRLHEYSLENTLFIHQYSTIDNIVFTIFLIITNCISPQTIRVYIINNDFKNLSSKWNNIDYLKCIIPDSVINLWKKPLKLPSNLALPDLEFVPDLPLFGEKFPEVIRNTLFVQLWYTYAIPKSRKIQQQTEMFFHFISPHVYENPSNTILNTIFVKLVKSAIQMDFLKDELQYHIKCTNYGMLIKITSYIPVTYDNCLSRIFSKILKLKVLPKKFEVYKYNMVEYLKSFVRLKPTEQAFFYISNLLSEKSWSYDEVLKASIDITIDKFQEFIQKFIGSIYVKSLIYGEISKEQALDIIAALEFNVRKANKILINILRHREVKLHNDTHLLLEVENKFHNISCTQVYYQIGKETMDVNAKLAFIYYIMLTRCSRYFKNIQHISKVHINQREVNGIQGLIITIEALMDPYIVQYHIKQFIFSTMNYINKLSTVDFKKYKTNLIRQSKLLNLNIMSILWAEISTKLYCSDQQKIEEKFIQNIEKTSLLMFYKENIYDKNATLSVHILPKHENKLLKEDSSQFEKYEENKTSDKPSAFNIPFKIHKSLVCTDIPKISYSISRSKNIRSIINKFYKKKIENYYYADDLHRFSLDICFKKIYDIALFKQTQNYYNVTPPILL